MRIGAVRGEFSTLQALIVKVNQGLSLSELIRRGEVGDDLAPP